jgi:acyl carrier protein
MASKTEAETLDEVLSLAAEQFQVERSDLSGADDFFAKLGIDSLKALEMLTRLENHFGVELPDYEMQGVSDFGTLADRIHARL